ncbi:hypothetical protein AAHA92_04358 [Salvia divinorum]|uniref:Retrotransposon Copia-like N-terminal domain-containing protein n=1 Tax=Salvia divinorum TaxID=28513 RepID=A0ABD1I272_SALDI
MIGEDDVKPGDCKLKTSKNVTVAFKLNGTNYPLWARLMKIAIGSRKAMRHITGVPTPPEPEDRDYIEWEEIDLVVFSWILDNIEVDIVGDFAHHQSAKAIWDSLAVTYESTADPYFIYDLEEKAGRIVQGEMTLETYWRQLHGIWVEIDRCENKPIDCCDKGVGQFRRHVTTRRLYKFLAGLNERYDGIKRDILKETPAPSVDVAYGWVKREATRLKIMPLANPDHPTGATSVDSSSGGVGFGFGVRNTRFPPPPATPRPGQQPPRPAAANNRRGGKIDKTKLWCSNCGMNKHTRENCFQLIGFSEWWDETQRAKARLAIGIEDGGGGNHHTPTGTGANGRGRGVDGDTPHGGGGRRREEVGEAAFAGRVDGNGASGSGGYQDEEDNWAWH